MSNFAQKHAIITLNKFVKSKLPDAIYNFVLFVWIRNYLYSFVEFTENKNKKKTENSDGEDSFRDETNSKD